MAQDYSFDVVSEVDLNLVSESIQVAMKEIANRFDFKDAQASIELNSKDKKLIFSRMILYLGSWAKTDKVF